MIKERGKLITATAGLLIFAGVIVFSLLNLNKLKTINLSDKESFNVYQEDEKKEDISKKAEKNDWDWILNHEKIYKLTDTEINLLLEELLEKFPDKNERLKALAIVRIDTPHKADSLGEESGRDKDPVFRTDFTDCTSFVLTNVALLHSENLEQARDMMKILNYRGGENISFENRFHFTLDRNMNTPYFNDVTQDIADRNKIIEKKVLLNKTGADGKRLIDIDWEKEIVLRYIANEYLTKEFMAGFPPVLSIAFIKESDAVRGLDVAHEGFLFDGKTLIYASSIYNKVVEADFMEYNFPSNEKPKFDGIMLFEVK